MLSSSREKERKDGRPPTEMRQIESERGLLNRADGSARWSQDKTCVLAAAYGPRLQPGKKENAERATLDVVFKPKSGVGGTAEREREHVLAQALESVVISALHPRMNVSVVVQVIEDDGAVLACSINAVCLALVDAGVPMQALLTAATLALTEDGDLLLDPTTSEQEAAKAVVTLAFRSRRGLPDEPPNEADQGVIVSVVEGALKAEEYFACVEKGRIASVTLVGEFMRQAIARFHHEQQRDE